MWQKLSRHKKFHKKRGGGGNCSIVLWRHLWMHWVGKKPADLKMGSFFKDEKARESGEEKIGSKIQNSSLKRGEWSKAAHIESPHCHIAGHHSHIASHSTFPSHLSHKVLLFSPSQKTLFKDEEEREIERGREEGRKNLTYLRRCKLGQYSCHGCSCTCSYGYSHRPTLVPSSHHSSCSSSLGLSFLFFFRFFCFVFFFTMLEFRFRVDCSSSSSKGFRDGMAEFLEERETLDAFFRRILLCRWRSRSDLADGCSRFMSPVVRSNFSEGQEEWAKLKWAALSFCCCESGKRASCFLASSARRRRRRRRRRWGLLIISRSSCCSSNYKLQCLWASRAWCFLLPHTSMWAWWWWMKSMDSVR